MCVREDVKKINKPRKLVLILSPCSLSYECRINIWQLRREIEVFTGELLDELSVGEHLARSF